MANNYNVNTAQFQPFTFEEMLKPVLMADTEHKNIQAALGEIDAKRALTEGALDKNRDVNSYNTNMDYLNTLQKVSSDLSSNGLYSVDRDQLNNLKTTYAQKIAPIERGIAARSKLAQLESNLDAKDNSMIYQRRAQDMSIDEFVKDPDGRPLNVSGNQLYTTSANAFSNLAKRIHSEGMLPSQAAGYLRNYVSRGYTEDQALKAMLGDSGYKQFQDIFNNVAQSYGLDKWEEGDPKNAAMENIYRGALHTIGVDDYKYMADREFIGPGRTANSPGPNTDEQGVLTRLIPKEMDLSKDQLKRVKNTISPLVEDLKASISNPNVNFREQILGNRYYTDAIRAVYNLPADYNIPEEYIPSTIGEVQKFIKQAEQKMQETTYKIHEHVYNISDPANSLDILSQNLGVMFSNLGTSNVVGYQNAKTSKKLDESPTDIKMINTDGSMSNNLTVGQVRKILNLKQGSINKVNPVASLSLNELEDDFRLNITNNQNESATLRIPVEYLINQSDEEDYNVGIRVRENRSKARVEKDYDKVRSNTNTLFQYADASFNTRVKPQK